MEDTGKCLALNAQNWAECQQCPFNECHWLKSTCNKTKSLYAEGTKCLNVSVECFDEVHAVLLSFHTVSKEGS